MKIIRIYSLENYNIQTIFIMKEINYMYISSSFARSPNPLPPVFARYYEYLRNQLTTEHN